MLVHAGCCWYALASERVCPGKTTNFPPSGNESMTIARRLIILAVVPLVVLLGLGFFSWIQLAKVETRTRYAGELQVESLAALGNISRQLTEMRVNVRSYLLARDSGERVNAKAAIDESKATLTRLLQRYLDELVSDTQDKR